MNAWQFKPSEITFSATVHELGDSGDELEAVVIKFVGPYGYGSAGHRDAAYMIAIRDYITECVLPCALVFDLRELQYEWGNDIWAMFRCDQPLATIVSDVCKGFQTCSVGRPMFDDLDAALEHLRPLAIQYRNKLLE